MGTTGSGGSVRGAAGGWVAWVDVDAFFASVERLADPRVGDRPLAVAGTGPRGVVASACYAARGYGVAAAVPTARARRACPRLVVVPPAGELYRQVGRRVAEVLDGEDVRGAAVRASVDEALVRVGVADERGGEEAAARIRARVREATGLAVSVGVAPAPTAARVAAGLAKPDGVRVAGDAAALLAPLEVEALPGVGPRTGQRLADAGLRRVGDVAAAPRDRVVRLVGVARGDELRRRAVGGDGVEDVAASGREAAQVSRERTFDVDVAAGPRLDAAVDELAAEVVERLARDGAAAGTVAVRVRDAARADRSRQSQLGAPVADVAAVAAVARGLARELAAEAGRVRLVGVAASGLSRDAAQGVLPLFAPPRPAPRRGEGAWVRHRRFGLGWVVGRVDEGWRVVFSVDGDGVFADPRRARIRVIGDEFAGRVLRRVDAPAHAAAGSSGG